MIKLEDKIKEQEETIKELLKYISILSDKVIRQTIVRG